MLSSSIHILFLIIFGTFLYESFVKNLDSMCDQLKGMNSDLFFIKGQLSSILNYCNAELDKIVCYVYMFSYVLLLWLCELWELMHSLKYCFRHTH